MTVLLVLMTFVTLVIADYLYGRKHATVALGAPEPSRAASRPRNPVIAGYEVPEHLQFHPGHAWALRESANLVRVGIDDFAARLVGPFDRIVFPRRGQWIRQGQRIWTIEKDGRKAEMVSPIEGIVTDINEAVASNPETARLDPYGEGWLVKVEAPDAGTNFRNLLGGDVARRWMEEAALRLRGRMPVLAGAVAQDGGTAVADVTSTLPGESWTALTHEFFLL